MKVAFIGAGSVVFTNNIIVDLLSYPQLRDRLHLSLMDIDDHRLAVASSYAKRLIDSTGAKASVTATKDSTQALKGADYVINTIQVGGLPASRIDFEIPRKHGLPQTIGDTHGIGGVFRALRTIPVVLNYCRQIETLCPQALLINYSNPMAMNTWAIYEDTGVKVVGLCHSVPHDHKVIARYLEIPQENLQFVAAGINHICWFLELTSEGKDVYPEFRQLAQQKEIYNDTGIVIQSRPMANRVRFEIMKHFGFYSAESSEHLAEYLPFYIKNRELVKSLNIPIGEYLRRCDEHEIEFQHTEEIAAGQKPLPVQQRSNEYAASIINALETGVCEKVYANVRNDGQISNLPDNCCVEIPCYVDSQGISKTFVGKLPLQLAAIIRWHLPVQELAVRAVLDRRKEYVYQACLLDPLAGSLLDPDRITTIVDELFDAHVECLRYFDDPNERRLGMD